MLVAGENTIGDGGIELVAQGGWAGSRILKADRPFVELRLDKSPLGMLGELASTWNSTSARRRRP
jgi:hypothetical protein